MKKRLETVLLLAVLLLSAPFGAAGKHLSGEESAANGRMLRLVTYNVGVFNKYIPGGYRPVADILKQLRPDAVCLNELDSCTTRTGGVFQLGRIAELMGGWNFRFGPAMSYQGGKYGVGIMTHEPIVESFVVPLPKGRGREPRALAVVELDDYVIATTHLDYASPEVQRQQIDVIDRFLKQRYGESRKPVFLGGDLNAGPDSPALAILRKSWRVLTPTGSGTFPSHAPQTCIDYILQLDNGAPPCEVVAARVVESSPAADLAKASDHLPVLLVVRLPADQRP